MSRFQVLSGLPPYGSTPLLFGAGGRYGGWGGHREGLVVRFYSIPEAWVANFQPGQGGWEGVLQHPNGQHIIVLAQGQGNVVDPDTRQLVLVFPGTVQHVVELPKWNAVIICDGLRFEAIRSDGIWWTSPRISWDEIRNIMVDRAVLRGEASAPDGGGNLWSPFTVDLMTGRCENGIYEKHMRLAIPVRAKPS